MRNLVVTSTIKNSGAKRTWIWDASTPLTLGHPFRWVIERTEHGVRVRDLHMPIDRIVSGAVREVALDQPIDLDQLRIELREMRVLPNPALRLLSPDQAPALDLSKAVAIDEESAWFQRALQGAALGLTALIAVALLWPKSKPDTLELVPAQFAKIVLSQPHKASAAAQTEASSAVAQATNEAVKSAPKTVQNAAVVQAFRAHALQSAVSGLLKGGMTSLLAQSDFVSGKHASDDARRIFNSKSDALRPTGEETGLSADHNVKVASIGGTSGSDGKGVGYTKGEHAAVKGQGSSFVSMDIAGAAVEEGLTKDEVGEVIHRHLSEVRYCYESAMIRSPDIEGKLVVNFTIGGTGAVKSSEVKTSTLPDPRLDDCILRRLTTWKFPQTKGGIDVAVSYPFIFKTLGR